MARRLILGCSALVLCMSGAMGLTASAADDPPVCTLIGCSNVVVLDTHRPPTGTKRLTFCVNDRCTRVALRQKNRAARLPCSPAETVDVTVTARNADGKRIARIKKTVALSISQPNGPACGPTCYGASLRLDGRKLTVTPPGSP